MKGFRRIASIGIITVLGIAGIDYASSGVKRDGTTVDITRNFWPISVVSYIHDQTTDRMLIYKPIKHLNDGVIISDYNRDGVPDEVSVNGQEFNRYGRDAAKTRDLFDKIDEVWEEYKEALDVTRKIEEELAKPYTPEEKEKLTPEEVMELL